MEWEEAKEVKRDIRKILKVIELPHVKHVRIFCYRTQGSKSRAYARIWAFPKIFQQALGIEPAYVIEVLAKYYDKLNEDQKTHVLIHELLHIPKNFSGALIPHRGLHKRINHGTVEQMFRLYKESI